MPARKDYETRFEEILTDITKDSDIFVYDVEYVKEGQDYYLRGFIDKDGGVTINDCEAVSRRVSDILDEKDFIKDAYILEISSPGLGRKLTKDRHFEMSLGKSIDINFYKAKNKVKQLSGILKAYDKDSITITDNGNDITLLKSDISKINLTVEW